MKTHNEHTVKSVEPSLPVMECAGGTCSMSAGLRSRLLWILLIGFLVYFQWPMLKGMYYKVSGTATPASAIAWRSDVTAALDEAKQSGKPVLLDFTASWCPPCRVMKQDVWPDGQVAATINDGYVPVLVDMDSDSNKTVAQRYEISGIPTIVIVDADGRILRQSGFMSKSKMLEFLRKT